MAQQHPPHTTRLADTLAAASRRRFVGRSAQVAVQPTLIGPMAFGTSVRVRSANTKVPGALSLTWIDVHSEAEADDVRQRRRAMAVEMMRMRGFLGWMGVVIAERLLHTHPVGGSQGRTTAHHERQAPGRCAKSLRTRPRRRHAYRGLDS